MALAVAAVAIAATVTSTTIQAVQQKKAAKQQKNYQRQQTAALEKSAGEAESKRIGKIAMEQQGQRRRRRTSEGGQPSTIFAGSQGQELGRGATSAKTVLGQ